MKLRPATLLRLFARFIGHCVLAGGVTARIILQRKASGPAVQGLVRLAFMPMSETGAAMLGAMVSLTPGTSVIDVDFERHEMLIHLLDVSTAESNLAAIRRDFERDIAMLYPAREER